MLGLHILHPIKTKSAARHGRLRAETYHATGIYMQTWVGDQSGSPREGPLVQLPPPSELLESRGIRFVHQQLWSAQNGTRAMRRKMRVSSCLQMALLAR